MSSEFRMPTPAELRALEDRARALRAAHMRAMTAGLWRRVATLPHTVATAFHRDARA